jgi:hypothetical protein
MCAALVASLATTGCSRTKIITTHNRAFDFAGLRTYIWSSEVTTGLGRLQNDPGLPNIVRDMVEEQLADRGYFGGESGQADFLVSYRAAIKGRLEGEATGDQMPGTMNFFAEDRAFGEGIDPNAGMRAPEQPKLNEYDEGSLIIDFVSPDGRKLLWRGVARTRIRSRATPQQRKQRLESIVRKMMAEFPPE